MRSGRALAAVAAGLLAAVLPGSAGATFPGATGLLAFQSDRGGDYGVWTSNADGSNPQPLYDPDGSHEFNPAWSPSGTHVVLQSGPLDRSTADLVLVDVLTGEASPLLTGSTNDFAAQFCDADTIAFARQTDPANSDIWTIDTDGTDLTQLTSAPGRQSFPTCSPNSRRISYISNQTGAPAIWEMNADGSGQHQVVAGLDPDYSPDWQALTYAAPDSNNLEIFRIDRDTGETTQLTDTAPPIQNRLPHYAPDYPNGPVKVYYTQIDPRLANPEQMRAITGDPTDQFTALCGNPPPDPPGQPPAAPGNNSAPAAQPAPGCRLSPAGTLTIEGTEGPDDILVRDEAMPTIRVTVNGTETSYPRASVKSIRILAGGGNDHIETSLISVPIAIDDGPGIDVVDGEVTIQGTQNADRVEIRTVEDDDEDDFGTTITVNGRTTSLGEPVDVKLEGFDGKDTVVTDTVTDVRINGWLYILGVRFMSRPAPVLRVRGTPKNDRMTIMLDQSATFRITRNGQEAPGITGIFGAVRVEVATGGGRDTVTKNVPINPVERSAYPRPLGGLRVTSLIETGSGDDRVTCRGAAQTCTVLGGAGNDTVDVRDGTRSVVDGGSGSDRVIADRADRVRRAEVVLRG